MANKNEKLIKYGALNRFYQNLKSHDISTLNDKIDNIDVPEYSAGEGIEIDSTNTISCSYQYNLPTANSDTLGGVKVGSGLTITDGILSNDISVNTIEDINNSIENINREINNILIPLNEQYLTIEAINNCSVYFINNNDTLAQKTIEYSTDGLQWTSVTSSNNGTLISNLLPSEKIYLRGNNSRYGTDEYITQYGLEFYSALTVNGNFIVYGNIMSLINSSDFKNLTSLSSSMTFYKFFYNSTGLINAGNLMLPATILTKSCYRRMFKGCTNLTEAPMLPATTLVDSCYSYMFDGCSSLTSIKCLATDISASLCTYKWVNNVGNNGVFEKSSVMSGWTTGNDGIPDNWIVKDYVEPNQVATQEYVDTKLAEKLNKVDYIIPYVPVQGADWTSLNGATENGSYKGVLRYSDNGMSLDMGIVDIYVVNSMGNVLQQIIPRGAGRVDFTFRTFVNGTTWTTIDSKVPLINDTTSSADNTYSSSKIDSLISALEARVAALEGNTTV